jgi:hypothetical protein
MGGMIMERDYLEWISNAYKLLCENKAIPRMDLKVTDGKISVYRVRDVIRIDIKREETKC